MASSKQKVVLITGCSTGIGLSTAVMLAKDAEKRFKVYATMRNLGKKEALETEGKDVLGSTLIIEQLDVCSEDQINKVVDGILAKEGKLDVLGKLEVMYYYNTTFQQTSHSRVVLCEGLPLPSLPLHFKMRSSILASTDRSNNNSKLLISYFPFI